MIKDVDVEAVEGIGFDATCSLVVLGPEYEPITVSPTGTTIIFKILVLMISHVFGVTESRASDLMLLLHVLGLASIKGF